MEREQLDFQAMIAKVLHHAKAHETVWNTVGPVADSVAALSVTDREISLSSLVQIDGTTGNTEAKNLAFGLSADLALRIGLRTAAWAEKNDKTDVLAAVDLSRTDLTQGAEQVLIQRHILIGDYADKYKVELAAYKVNDAAISELRTATATYLAIRDGRNEKSVHRIYSTAAIGDLIAKARKQLSILDKEVRGLIDDKEFVETYLVCRRITDTAVTRAGAGTEAATAGA